MADNKKAIVEALEAQFPKAKDSYGNFKFSGTGGTFRVKVNSTSLRFERQIVYSFGEKEWINMCKSTQYYKDLTVEKAIRMASKLEEYSKRTGA